MSSCRGEDSLLGGLWLPRDTHGATVGRVCGHKMGERFFQGVISSLLAPTKLPLPLDKLLPKQP